MSDQEKFLNWSALERNHPWVVMWILMSAGVLLSFYLKTVFAGALTVWYPNGLEVYAAVGIGLVVAIAYTALGKFKPPTKTNALRRRALVVLAGMGWEAWLDRVL